MTSVTQSLNAAILTGAPVASTLTSGKTSPLTSSSLASLTGGSLLSASLGSGLDQSTVLAGLTSKGMSEETLAALNKAIADNPYSASMLAIGTQASLMGSVGGASSFYSASLSLLNAAYAPKLPAGLDTTA